MFSINVRLTIGLYLIAVFIILYSRPIFIFNNQGNLKSFGIDKNSENNNYTLLPLWLIFTIIAFFSYYIMLYIEL